MKAKTLFKITAKISWIIVFIGGSIGIMLYGIYNIKEPGIIGTMCGSNLVLGFFAHSASIWIDKKIKEIE